jgi:hypothetical protein
MKPNTSTDPHQETKKPIELISLSAVKVYAIDQGGTKHPATAFLYEDSDKTYLVTNWHVLTGRDPSNRKISKTGALVTHLEVAFHFTPDQKHVSPYQSARNTYEILNINSMTGTWLEHNDSEIDVAILEVATPENALITTLNKIPFDTGYEPTVSEEVFVIGFPEGLAIPDTTLPLWKGGTIASDPAVHVGRKPLNLIDCDTYEGMSGAPVIARRQSGLFLYDGAGKMRDDSVFGEVRQFFGIYSGRVRQKIGDELIATKFGVVWRARVVDEILRSPHTGCVLR